jgi:hypothetical protein
MGSLSKAHDNLENTLHKRIRRTKAYDGQWHFHNRATVDEGSVRADLC